MIFINQGSKHFFFKKKLVLLTVLKCFKSNFFLNFSIKKIKIVCFSKGKGFQGVIKRWSFKTKDKTHGCSLSYRTLGSTGQCQTPGRVFKGKKMPGRMGNKKITLNTKIYFRKNNLFFIDKILPGNINNYIKVKLL